MDSDITTHPMLTQPSLSLVKQILDTPHNSTEIPNLIPIHQEISADLLTPVSAYLKLSNGCSRPHSFLFESVASGEKIGRYSFLGVNPHKIIQTADTLPISGDPLVHLDKEFNAIKYFKTSALPEFTGGAVGYISYDCIRYFEPKTAKTTLRDTLNIPDAIFMIFDTIVIFDHLHHLVKVVSHVKLGPLFGDRNLEAEYARAAAEISQLVHMLQAEPVPLPQQPPIVSADPVSNIGKAGYEDFVKKLKHHILDGDIIQAVPSQRISKPTTLHPFNAYRTLRSVNPSPYMFYVDCKDFHLVGASPELLVSVDTSRKVTNHPIAGTVRRGTSPDEDDALALQLLSDQKERAEHIQLVDLGRNDVNRVCDPKTVKVDSLMHIERFSHVMHIVSHVSGTLRDDKTPFDAFRSIFPAGTVSGAPKVRAMELIYELERDHRAIYAGAVGHFDYAGGLDTCIAIRTMLFKDGVAYLQAGGGIVHDSDPKAEFQETLHKLNSNVMSLAAAEAYYSNQSSLASNPSHNDSTKVKPTLANLVPNAPPTLNSETKTHVTTSQDATTVRPISTTTTITTTTESAISSSSIANLTDSSTATSGQLYPSTTLLIDNYDSFTWNVYQRLCELGANVVVLRNDQVTVEECLALNPRNVVISPGPGTPRDAGVSNDVILAFAGKVPVLGVCLGAQCMYELYGGEVTYAGETVHGKTSAVTHDGLGLYKGVPQRIQCTRYHSLAASPSTLPECLAVTSFTDSGVIMGVRHNKYVMEGVQFHPESITSEYGRMLFRNFLAWEGATWDELVYRDDLVPITLPEDGSDVGHGRDAVGGGGGGGGVAGPPCTNRFGGGVKIHSAAHDAIAPSINIAAVNGSSITPIVISSTTRDIQPQSVFPSFKQASILETISRRRLVDASQDKLVPGKSQGDISQSIELGLAPPLIDFYQRILSSSKPPHVVAVMAEIKRSSPSKGNIDSSAHAAKQALVYAKAGAAVISVLTEPRWFKGSLDDLRLARTALNLVPNRPAILRKEFVVDEYQIYEGRLAGADSVLLIVAILNDQQLSSLMSTSRMLGMEPLVEVANAEEMERAIKAGAKVIGVNNRDLHTFNVDPSRTSTLASMVPPSVILVALSGISSRTDVEPYIAAGARAVLVGEALMRSGKPGDLIASLSGHMSRIQLPKHAKICGLTRPEDAILAAKNGASFLGIVLAPSARQQSPEQAAELVKSVHEGLGWSDESLATHLLSLLPRAHSMNDPIQGLELGYKVLSNGPRPLFVGVFQDQSLGFITAAVTRARLDVVQLHGDEPDSIIPSIPAPVIRVIHVGPGGNGEDVEEKVISAVVHGAAAVLLDAAITAPAPAPAAQCRTVAKGGAGQVFDWSVASHVAGQNMYIMLAGGLTSENVGRASLLGRYVWCVDTSSGVESGMKGVKEDDKIRSFLKAIL
ncbi:hypothetical protein SeLEV6574_g05762 [Synchytrium endobioticum]|nr:hypothetical protein SeLEV6574_g05762 [Synchytrium endobioticum]